MPRRFVPLAAVLLAVILANSCGRVPKPVAKETLVGWRPAVTFSGHGDRQTDSFDIDNGLWRIKWETRNENPPGKGTFKVVVHSAISGRAMMQLVDHRGVGHDVEYVAEDPRLYFLVIESANVDWSVTVEESSTGNAENRATSRSQPSRD